MLCLGLVLGTHLTDTFYFMQKKPQIDTITYLYEKAQNGSIQITPIVEVYVNDRLVFNKTGDYLTTNFFNIMRIATKQAGVPLQIVALSPVSTYNMYMIGCGWSTVFSGGLTTDGAYIYAINTTFTPSLSDSYVVSILQTNGILLPNKIEYATETVGSYTLRLRIAYSREMTYSTTIYGAALCFSAYLATSVGGAAGTTIYGQAAVFPVANDAFTSIGLSAGDVLKIRYIIQIN